MSRESEKLFDAVTGIDGELVAEAEAHKPRRRMHPAAKAALSAAACLCIVLGAGLFAFFNLRMGSSTAPEPDSDGSDGYSAVYTGPVLPLTTAGDASGLSAEREIVFDFAGYEYLDPVSVRDSYEVYNGTDGDITCTMLYPYTGSLLDAAPVISVDGAEVSAIGAYVSTDTPETFEGYLDAAGLSAEDCVPLPDTEVYVYELSVPGGLESDEWVFFEYPARADWQIYTVGCVSGTTEHGRMTMGFDPNRSPSVFSVGRRIEDYSAYAGPDGAQDSAVSVTERAVSFSEFTSMASEATWKRFAASVGDGVTYADFHNALAAALAGGARNAEGGLLASIASTVVYSERIQWRAFELTVPEGESVTVSVGLQKAVSYDDGAPGERGSGAVGLDLSAFAGTRLRLTGVSAEIVNFDGIEITSHNFGFDPDKGVTRVSLDPGTERYYIDIRRA